MKPTNPLQTLTALFFLAISVSIFAPLARGQTFELLHSFQNSEGGNPQAGLVQGSDGDFYGTTLLGDNSNFGTVFKMTTNGALTTLVLFNNTNGSHPWAGLVQRSDGNFYGTTQDGGDLSLNSGLGFGTVFKMTTNGALTMLVSFNSTNGAYPKARLAQGKGGCFYGTTYQGGAYTNQFGGGSGTVFQITTNGILTTLVLFSNTNGSNPWAGLVEGSDGNFYGTTQNGGDLSLNSGLGFGTVFKMTTNGALTMLVLFNFTNGAVPYAGLVEGSDGNFYGTTADGGANNRGGTAFQMTTNGILTTLVSFDGSNGANPWAGLLQESDGNFYGTTLAGGNSNFGTVFKMTTSGVVTTLVTFNGSNGSFPFAELTRGNDGNFYGTTYDGGASNLGTIFRIVMPVSLNARQSGNQIVLSWPTNALGFTLQSVPNLNSPVNWIDSTNSPSVVGAQFVVTNPISGSAQFFRLKK